MIHRLLMSTLLLTSAASMAAPDGDAARIQAFIDDSVQRLGVKTGLAVRVIQDGEVILSSDSGFADIQAGMPIDPSTAFYIASVTKPFTALAALRLHERGLIDLDRSLASYFPEVKFTPELKAEAINSRHLLTHTAGISNDGLVLATAFTGIHTPELLEQILAESTVNEAAPFGAFEYTNVGYNIFSMILERELGRSWQDILAEEVFAPLALTHTSAYMSQARDQDWTVARPYSFSSPDPDQPLYLSKTDGTMHAAGGMVASADDLARLVRLQLEGGMLDGERIVPRSTIDYSQSTLAHGESSYGPVQRLGYGFGWRIGRLDGDRLIHHYGGFAGTHAHASFMPEHGIGLVVLNNEDMVASRLTGFIAGYVYAQLTGKTDAAAAVEQQVAQIATQLPMLRERIAQEHEKVQSREWQLTLAPEAYSGHYVHPLYGTIEISSGDDGFEASFGNMRAKPTAFTEPDTMRVTFVPGSGKVIAFVSANGAVQSLKYDGQVFERRR